MELITKRRRTPCPLVRSSPRRLSLLVDNPETEFKRKKDEGKFKGGAGGRRAGSSLLREDVTAAS